MTNCTLGGLSEPMSAAWLRCESTLRFMLMGCERGTTLLPVRPLASGEDDCATLRCVGTGIGSEIGKKHGLGGLIASRLVCLTYLCEEIFIFYNNNLLFAKKKATFDIFT